MSQQSVSNQILGVWKDPISGAKIFTTQKEMRPKPKYREMNLVNPNERPVVQDIAENETG